MTEKFMTLHPEGKTGTNINKEKYEAVREAILDIIHERREVPFSDLADAVGAKLTDFDGSIGWYTTTVKLDLEARGEVERIPKRTPQVLRLCE